MRRVLVKIAALALLIIPAMAQAGTTTMFTWQVENGPEPSLLQDTGTGIRVRNNQGTTNGSYPDANRSKTFNFTVACSGTYFLSGLYCAGGNGSNSWYVHIRDGGGFVTDTAGHNDATGNDSAWSMAIGGCARNGTVNGENGGYGTRYWQLNANTNYSIVLRGREGLALLYNLSLIRDDSQPVLCGTPTPTPAPTAVGTGTGLSGFYYDDIDLGGTPECRLDPTVDFNWGTGSPNDGGAVNALGSDDFSVSWVGEIEAPADGDYTFYFRSDDGARVYINGNLEINQWGDQSATEYATASYTLAAGERVSITIEYYERSTNAVAQLSWTGPGIPKTIIPQDRLFPAGCAEPTRIPTPDVTLTPTNTPVPYTSGLHAGGRLYGLEYIPFPAQTVGGNTLWIWRIPCPPGRTTSTFRAIPHAGALLSRG